MRSANPFELQTKQYLWPDFVVRRNCVFLEISAPKGKVHWSSFHDRTAVESFYNHLHVDELRTIKRNRSIKDSSICALGHAVAAAWAAKLAVEFPRRSFWVYYTNENDPIVRFHSQHQNEQPWLNIRTAPKSWRAFAYFISRGQIKQV
jgi:hypothetical protein